MDSAQCSDLCSDCVEKFSKGQLKIWNDIIQKDPIPPQFKRNNSLAAEDIARVAHEISAKSNDMDITSDLAKFFEVDVKKQLEQFGPVSKEHEIMLILLEWSRRYRGGEPAKDLARKLLELNSIENSKHYSCNLEKLARDLSPYVTASELFALFLIADFYIYLLHLRLDKSG